MAHLILPHELLTIIFSFLAGESSALAQICLVCREFNTLATPILYICFRQDYDLPEDDNRRLFAFIKTVLARPDLAQHVKQVAVESLTSRDGCKITKGDDLKCAFDNRIDVLSRVLFENSEDYMGQTWKIFSENGSSKAILTVLLCSLPNVETLLFKEDGEPAIFLDSLSSAAFKLRAARVNNQPAPQIPFSKLHSVRMISDDLEYGFQSFLEMHRFFSLPNIRNVEISLANAEWTDEAHEPERWDVEPRSSPVEKLSFQCSTMVRPCITTIIDSCAHLKEFHFTYGRMRTYKDDFTPIQLLRALVGHAGSLEVLHVNYDDDWPKASWELLSPEDLRFSNELRGLSKLRKVHVTFSTLFGISIEPSEEFMLTADQAPLEVSLPDMLPNSLEELTIITCDERVIHPLQNLAKSCQCGQFQKLRRICCAFSDEYTKHSDVVMTEIPAVDVEYLFEDSCERTSRFEWQDRSEIYDDDMLLYQ